MRPTMFAHTNETVQVTLGNTRPLTGSVVPVGVFRGYEIGWIVQEKEAPQRRCVQSGLDSGSATRTQSYQKVAVQY